MKIPPVYEGLSDFSDRYDFFILDVWGVLYDGMTSYEGAPEAMDYLKSRGKRVLLLSNSPKRAARLKEKVITAIGIAPDTYEALLTSGEAAHAHMRAHHNGQRVYTFVTDEPFTALDGLNVTRVADVNDADFIYGSLVPRDAETDDYTQILAEALSRKIPFVCGNPDRVVGYGENLVLCAGSLAEAYENMGGPVIWIGKPYRPIYDQAWEALGRPDKSRMVAIGDSLLTDISGAVNFGCDVIWNVTGIHWDELQSKDRLDSGKVVAALEGQPQPAGLMHGFKV